MRPLLMAVLAAALSTALPGPGMAQQPAPPSQDLPEALLGTYASGAEGCKDGAFVVQVTPRSVVTMRMAGENRLMRVAATDVLGGWTVATGTGEDMPRVLLRTAGEGAGSGIEHLVPAAKLTDDQLPGPGTPVRLLPCAGLPPALAVLHGEGLALLHALETMEPACTAGPLQACLDAFMVYADLNRDGKLNVAELSRTVRGATWLAQMSAGTEAGPLAEGAGAALLGGLAAAEVLVRSFDFDGQGTITPQQLMRDRLPVELRPQPRGRAAAPLELERIVPQLGALKGLLGL